MTKGGERAYFEKLFHLGGDLIKGKLCLNDLITYMSSNLSFFKMVCHHQKGGEC